MKDLIALKEYLELLGYDIEAIKFQDLVNLSVEVKDVISKHISK